jgi:hypothetical protein
MYFYTRSRVSFCQSDAAAAAAAAADAVAVDADAADAKLRSAVRAGSKPNPITFIRAK